MATTTRWGLRYPELDGSDSPDVPLWMSRLATDLDGVAMDDQGLFTSRPTSTVGTPGKKGRYYYATDTKQLFRDTGTSWIEVALLPTPQEAWHTIAVANFTGSARYMKDTMGFVHFRADPVTNSTDHAGTVPHTYFTLPSGYRPEATAYFPFPRTNATESRHYVVSVSTAGTVALANAPDVNGIGAGWNHTFGCVHFKAA